MAKEIWKTVPSTPHIEASSFGYVRTVNMATGRRGKERRGSWDGERFITQIRGQNYKVARLVCEAFNGPPSGEKNVCIHLDEDSKNNTPENLAWSTQEHNLNMPLFKSRRSALSKKLWVPGGVLYERHRAIRSKSLHSR